MWSPSLPIKESQSQSQKSIFSYSRTTQTRSDSPLSPTWKNLSIRSRSIPVHSLLKVCRKLSRYNNSAANSTSSLKGKREGLLSHVPDIKYLIKRGKLTSVDTVEAVDQGGDLVRQLLLKKEREVQISDFD